jgi:hypothetical protein
LPLIEALNARRAGSKDDRPSREAKETKKWSPWINCILLLIYICCFNTVVLGRRAGLLLPARLDGKMLLSTCWWLKIKFMICTPSMTQLLESSFFLFF